MSELRVREGSQHLGPQELSLELGAWDPWVSLGPWANKKGESPGSALGWRWLKEIGICSQSLARLLFNHFFMCKWPDGKYFQLCGNRIVCHTCFFFPL